MSLSSRRIKSLLLALLLGCALTVWSQDAQPQAQTPQTGSAPDQTGQPGAPDQGAAPNDQNAATPADQGAVPAATGPGEQTLENPPLSGLDSPTSEPVFGGRSYLVPGLQVSEAVDSNPTNRINSTSNISEITRVLGSVDLQKLWKRYQVGLDYVGGGVFYTGSQTSLGQTSTAYQMHSFAIDNRFPWRTGQLAIRDTLNYLPEGTFGFGSFGGYGGYGTALGGGVTGVGAGTGLGGGLTGGTPNGGFGSGQYGSIGTQPRIDNLSIIDVTQMLSPKSSMTFAGGYDVTDYLDKTRANFSIINSQQTTGQVGYNRLLTRKDQIGFMYGFQEIHFPHANSGSLDVHYWNAMYGRRITGRLNFVVGGGPQLVVLHNPPTVILGIFTIPANTTLRWAGNGQVSLGYIVSNRTHINLVYQHYVTPGSGFVAGANTDAGRATITHLIGRHWDTSVDGGYSHNSALLNNGANGINSHSYQYWYAGGSLSRRLGQHFSAFLSYQYDRFGSSGCSTASGSHTVCGGYAPRNTGSIGIDWHPHVIRLD